MRVWDFPPHLLCSCHLSGEHKEIHDIFGILKRGKSSPYYKHPEVQRWIGKEYLLWQRHELVASLLKNHKSPIEEPKQCSDELGLVDSIEDQIKNIAAKSQNPDHRCSCDLAEINKWHAWQDLNLQPLVS